MVKRAVPVGESGFKREEVTDVLIVGAGPTGLTLAIGLTLAGVDFMIIDSAETPSKESKAAVVHGRSLEILEQFGVLDLLVERGAFEVPRLEIHDGSAVLMNVDFSKLDMPFPCTMMSPQSMTEAALEQRLTDLGGAVRRGHALDNLVNAVAPSGPVEARIAVHGDESDSYVVRAKYVVGCDGSHSKVRHFLGVSFDGSTYRQQYVLADAKLESRLSNEAVHLFANPEGFLVVAPLRRESHRIIVSMDTPPNEITVDVINRLLAERGPGGGSAQVSEVLWSAPFRIHKRVADRFRVGRAFLCGDAAHIHSTIGGQGMNTGIQDAAHLGWRLAVILNGNGDDSLLDEWNDQRRTNAKAVLEFTHRLTEAVTRRSRAFRATRNIAARSLGRLPFVEMGLAARLAGMANSLPPRYPSFEKQGSGLAAREREK